MQTKQLTINYDRAEQLGFLRDAQIPNGERVRSMTCKMVLSAIDDFCRGNGDCFASQATLASVANCSRRTTQRAIEHLMDLGILVCHRRSVGNYGGVTNTYTINWDRIKTISAAKVIDQIIETAAAEQLRPVPAEPARSIDLEPASMEAVDQALAGSHQTAVNRIENGQNGLVENLPSAPKTGPTNAPLGQTNAPLGQTNAPLGPTNAPLGRTNRQEAQEPPPTAGPDAVVVAKILQSSGLSKAKSIELASRHPITIAEADRAVRTFEANSRKFRAGAGAIVWFFENGQWPAAGVIEAPTRESIEEQSRRREAERQAELQREAEIRAEEQRLADLESKAGPAWDRLPGEQQAAFAREKLSEFEFGLWRSGKRSMVRDFLLTAFQESGEFDARN